MINAAKESKRRHLPASWQERFLELLPAIEQQVAHRLRGVPEHQCEDLASEAIALALVMCIRLAERGRISLAYATPLADYGCRQALDGRRLGTPLNIRDVSSRHCQKRKSVRMQRLDQYAPSSGEWREAVVEDYRTPVAEQAAFRCDFPAWLDSLETRERQIAQTLAVGESTSCVARIFNISSARVSQLRRELRDHWLQFHGEPVAVSPAC